MNYEAMAEYALRENRLGEEFFRGKMKTLSESVLERMQQLEARAEAHRRVLDEINQERAASRQRASMFTYRESQRALLPQQLA